VKVRNIFASEAELLDGRCEKNFKTWCVPGKWQVKKGSPEKTNPLNHDGGSVSRVS